MSEAVVPIRPAATVILLRQGPNDLEVLLLQRNSSLVFGGDHWVFPGGRIDEQDHRAGDGTVDAAERIAAVRETHEEAGLTVDPALLTPVSRWTTPKPSPKRYRTAFFVTAFEEDTVVTVDGSEIVDHQWLTAATAIEHFDCGDKKMMPPTIHTLHEIAGHRSAAEYIALCAGRAPIVFDAP